MRSGTKWAKGEIVLTPKRMEDIKKLGYTFVSYKGKGIKLTTQRTDKTVQEIAKYQRLIDGLQRKIVEVKAKQKLTTTGAQDDATAKL